MDASRYDRQQRIRGWNQAALARARVLVAGAGALGNELLKNLVLLGVGQLLVVDFDLIEPSNLSRTVLFQTADVGRSKAQTAAQAAVRLNPEVDVRYIDGDLFYDIGLGFYRHCDLVVGGLDSLAARSQVGLSCTLAGVPFLDGGMWALGGEVRWFMAGDGPCFECTLSEEDRQRAYERRSCTGFRTEEVVPHEQYVPTTISTAAIVGGMLAQETSRYLCGWDVPAGQAAVYNGLTLSAHLTTLSRDSTCPYHRPYENVVELDRCAHQLTGREILQLATSDSKSKTVLSLGRDFLLEFHCPQCHRCEQMNTHLNRVDDARQNCPHCGAKRRAEIVSQLDEQSSYGDRPLSELGVPLGEVLAVQAGPKLALYELSRDVIDFWT